MVELWIPPHRATTYRERTNSGNFSGMPVRINIITEVNITMCWKRKFRLNRRNISPSSCRLSFRLSSLRLRSSALRPAAVRIRISRSISSWTRRRIFSRISGSSVRAGSLISSERADSISSFTSPSFRSRFSAFDMRALPRCGFLSGRTSWDLLLLAAQSSCPPLHVEEDMQDEGEHGSDGEILEEQRGVVDDPRFLLVGVDMHLSHGEVRVRPLVAFPASPGDVLRIHLRHGIARGTDVVRPVAGGAVGDRLRPETVRSEE